MARFLAAVEVDQRQRFILETDKLQEMLGASRIIGESVDATEQTLKRHQRVRLAWRVSGVQWLIADELAPLGQCLWEIRQVLLEDLCLSASFAIVEWEARTPFKIAVDALELRIRQQKDNKSGDDGSPASPWFAQCRLQPNLPANIWVPDAKTVVDERRRLISSDANLRRAKAAAYRNQWEDSFSCFPFYNTPEDFEDFVESETDSYIAVIKADMDGMGRLLAQLDWDELGRALGAGTDAPEASLKFSKAVDDCVRQSLIESVDTITRVSGKIDQPFPILPVVVAGDDLWIVARKSKAYPFVLEMGARFATRAKEDSVLKTALEVSGLTGKEQLTFSFGILFAKQGYPFDAQLDLAEELVHSAKKLRGKHKEGCLDFHWLESSARETVEVARRRDYEYRELGLDNHLCKLYTRPWTLSDAHLMESAARKLADSGIVRRKLYQLSGVLRMGGNLTLLAIHQWWSRLEGDEQRAFLEVVSMLPDPWKISREQLVGAEGRLPLGPWRETDALRECGLLELVELAEILRSAQPVKEVAA